DCAKFGADQTRPGVATNIYIGASEKKCSSDSDCGGAFGSCDIENSGRCWTPIDPIGTYELATSNYLALGGSGFRVLQRNTTQFDTGIQQRDALIDYIRAGLPCGADADGKLTTCQKDADCAGVGDGFVCACPEAAVEGTTCSTNPKVSCAKGACVLAQCRED